MPAPAKTSIEEIVAVARQLLENRGLEGLTVQAVANAIGIRAPSLYKRIGGRGDLVRRVGNSVAVDLVAAVEAAAMSGDPRQDLRAIARAARTFASQHPRAYPLLFADVPDAWRVDPALNERLSGAVIRVAGALADPTRELEAARLVVAWLHGFVSMEQAGVFRMGGSVDNAFEYGIDTLIAGLSSGQSSARRVGAPRRRPGR